MDFFKCPVCQQNLVKSTKTYECNNHHVYDIAAKGYTNFLLANQHHSLNPGDSKEMILARVRFLETDKYHILRETIYEQIEKYVYNIKNITFCDIACGEGYYTNYIHKKLSISHQIDTVGIDISKYGVIEGCKKIRQEKIKNIEYIIGNLSNMPFINESFDVLLNCFAPMDNNEFARVLKKDGIYIRVLPDFDHLWGIKEVLYKEIKPNIMKSKKLDGFTLIDEIKVHDDITLDNNQMINDLFMMTPYYYKSPRESSKKLQSMDKLNTIISFVLLIYKKDNFIKE